MRQRFTLGWKWMKMDSNLKKALSVCCGKVFLNRVLNRDTSVRLESSESESQQLTMANSVTKYQ